MVMFYLAMRKISSKPLIIVLSFLFCGIVLLLLKSPERYNIMTIAESIDRKETVKVYFDCIKSNTLMHNEKTMNGSVKIKFENGVEITYSFCNPITDTSEDIYMVHIAGNSAIPSAEYGMTVPAGFLYFEDNMDTFALSQIHPYLGDFIGVKEGEISDAILEKYSRIIEVSE